MSVPSETEPDVIRIFTRDEAPGDFEKALALRFEVFVDEMAIPADRERDEYEDECRHFLLTDADGQSLAAGRMRGYQEGCQMRPVAKLERIAVKSAMRGQKLGERLVRTMLDAARAEGFDQAILDSQVRAVGFYEKLGFVAEGDEFIDADIPHVRMRMLRLML